MTLPRFNPFTTLPPLSPTLPPASPVDEHAKAAAFIVACGRLAREPDRDKSKAEERPPGSYVLDAIAAVAKQRGQT